MEERPVVDVRPRTFSKEEKVALLFLIVAGIGGLFFGVKYLGKNLEAPFSFSYDGPEYLTGDQQEEREAEEMKSRDTDGDTLSDYDEVYVYKTSAYLTDSDSDGFDDASELASLSDPNCPVGKTCSSPTSTDQDVISNLLGSGEAPAFDFGQAQASLNASTGLPTEATNLTAAELRELLAQNGADPEVLAQISDAELMQMYEEVLTEFSNTTP